MKKSGKQTEVDFQTRLKTYYDELKWLYFELYPGKIEKLDALCNQMEIFYKERKASLKKLDQEREKNPSWYKKNDLVGMMMYTDAFADNLLGVKEKKERWKQRAWISQDMAYIGCIKKCKVIV